MKEVLQLYLHLHMYVCMFMYLTIAISSSSSIRCGIPSHLTIYHGLERNIHTYIIIVVHFVIRLIQKYNRRRLLRWMKRMTLLYIQLEGLLRLPFKHNFTTTPTTSTRTLSLTDDEGKGENRFLPCYVLYYYYYSYYYAANAMYNVLY